MINLKYLETILVHPMTRQNFAGKLHQISVGRQTIFKQNHIIWRGYYLECNILTSTRIVHEVKEKAFHSRNQLIL